jgi:hypothetical protein
VWYAPEHSTRSISAPPNRLPPGWPGRNTFTAVIYRLALNSHFAGKTRPWVESGNGSGSRCWPGRPDRSGRQSQLRSSTALCSARSTQRPIRP